MMNTGNKKGSTLSFVGGKNQKGVKKDTTKTEKGKGPKKEVIKKKESEKEPLIIEEENKDVIETNTSKDSVDASVKTENQTSLPDNVPPIIESPASPEPSSSTEKVNSGDNKNSLQVPEIVQLEDNSNEEKFELESGEAQKSLQEVSSVKEDDSTDKRNGAAVENAKDESQEIKESNEKESETMVPKVSDANKSKEVEVTGKDVVERQNDDNDTKANPGNADENEPNGELKKDDVTGAGITLEKGNGDGNDEKENNSENNEKGNEDKKAEDNKEKSTKEDHKKEDTKKGDTKKGKLIKRTNSAKFNVGKDKKDDKAKDKNRKDEKLKERNKKDDKKEKDNKAENKKNETKDKKDKNGDTKDKKGDDKNKKGDKDKKNKDKKVMDKSTTNGDVTLIVEGSENSKSQSSKGTLKNKWKNTGSAITLMKEVHLISDESVTESTTPTIGVTAPDDNNANGNPDVKTIKPNESRLSVSSGRRPSSESRRSLDGSHVGLMNATVVNPQGYEEKKTHPGYVINMDDSPIRQSIPILPLPTAIFCLILSIFVPGLGTIASSFFALCCSKTKEHKKTEPLAVVFCTNIWVGFSQMFTVLLCLVGWFWGIVWGVFMIILAVQQRQEQKDRRERELQALALTAFSKANSLPFGQK